MAITLNPAVNTLGIMAPVLGPWFSDNTVNLPVPNPADKLRLNVNFPAGTDWFAPAAGTLSLYITNGAAPPPALDALQDSDGAWPFPNNRILAIFRLLPEVQARLHALMGLVPSASGAAIGNNLPAAAGTPTRPEVRSLAVLLPAATPLTPAGIYPFFGGAAAIPSPNNTDAERMAVIGLAIDNGGNLVNAAMPMTWLRRPGGAVGDRDRLLQGLSGQTDLWAFDRRGRAIDPGAVACWWSWLLNTGVGNDAGNNTQLLAPGIQANAYPQANNLPMVVLTTAQRTLHIVDAHEGQLAAPFLGDRLQRGTTVISTNLIQVTGNTSIALSFTAAPTGGNPTPDNPLVDSAPRARMAALPDGNYGTAVTIWQGGPGHAALDRDFARVAVVEEERHLVGVARRGSRLAIANAADRRGSAQNRPSTRINVNRTANAVGVLLTNSQLAATTVLALPNAQAPTRLVLGIADVAWGGAPGTAPPAPGVGPLPAALADSGATAPGPGQYRVRALIGGGALAEDHQSVLVELNLGNACAGSWIRAWPLGFDLDTGVHFRLTGGAGRADATGLARIVMLLANGRVDAAGLLGMDMLVLLPSATTGPVQRSYADRRFSRPAPVAGAAATAVAGAWAICEAGLGGTGAPLPNGSVPPGGHVVVQLDTSPAVLDRTTVPAAAWDANTLVNRLQGGTDIVSLTDPAFGATPNRAEASGRPLPTAQATLGDADGGIDTLLGGRLHRLNRNALVGLTAASVPYALLDRLEVAGASVNAGAATAAAAIGAAPPVPWGLEPGANFFLGHPLVPASIETHGTGVSLTGLPALAVAEYVRERTAGLGFAQVQGLAEPARSMAVQSEIAVAAEAGTAFPTIADGAGAGPVVAVLRTSAFGMEGLPGVATGAIAANAFPLSQNEAQLEAWLDQQITAGGGAGTALRNAVGNQIDAITRALDRRLLTSAFGAREALTALLAAIGRAQDLIVIETPAVDMLAIDSAAGGENIRLWQAVLDRMTARPGLRVVLCAPTLLLAGAPKRLQEIRDAGLMAAANAARNLATDRFALFSPGAGAGRAVRIASTSVVVDDAFALTGTTHLWRRGLSWDSSLAAAVFDERVVDGRPQDVRAFRIQLLADRLGIPATRVPEDPAELVKAIRDFDMRGSARLSVTPIPTPPTPPGADFDTWNPDGSKMDLDLAAIAALFAAAVALTDPDHAITEG